MLWGYYLSLFLLYMAVTLHSLLGEIILCLNAYTVLLAFLEYSAQTKM